MRDLSRRLRVAVAQAAPVFLDREATTEKACQLIREAGRMGARVVGFPEGFIPGHPLWYHFYPATHPRSVELAARLFENAVEIPSETTAALGAAAREAGVYVVMGLCERRAGTFGTLYNTQLFIGPDGSILGKHQKLVPTVGERLVHVGGSGRTLQAFPTDFGRIAGLICAESTNPLAVAALAAEYPQVIVVSWPNLNLRFGVSGSERVGIAGRALALMTKAFVLNCRGTMTEAMREVLLYTEGDRAFLWDEGATGGSTIIDPWGRVIAGPMGAEEGILCAEVDLFEAVKAKMIHDYAGHSNRPDVFHLTVRAGVESLVTWEGERHGPGALR
jgi:aliphatic nitrilase